MTTSRWIAFGGSVVVFAAGAWVGPAQTPNKRSRASGVAPTFVKDVKPMLSKYCIDCHSGKDAIGGFDVTKLLASSNITSSRQTWQRVMERVIRGEMPPSGKKPATSEKERFAAFLRGEMGADCNVADPGKVTLRRLNREEYSNTIRDLFGLDLRPGNDLPSDDVGYGFDNIGDVLSTSPLLMEKYLSAAEKIAHKVILIPGVRTERFNAVDLEGAQSSSALEASRLYYSNSAGQVFKNFDVPAQYRVRITAYGQQAGPDPCRMGIVLDGQVVSTVDVRATEKSPKQYEGTITVPKGRHGFGAAFLNDFYDEKLPAGRQDRNLVVQQLELIGPLDVEAPMPDYHRRIIPQSASRDTAVHEARKDLRAFASRAYRRPVTDDEVDRLQKIWEVAYKETGSFEQGMRLGVEAILVSPQFLFRVEPDTQKGVRNLNDYEIASRLSYFLWSSMPDDTLFDLAAQKKLHLPAVLEQQVVRMVRDPRAKAMSDNFAGQWLQLKKLAIVNPDNERFPGIDDAAKRDMATETKMFFDDVVTNDRSALDFIDSKYTFLNGRLAHLYGEGNVEGNEFRRVEVGGQRGGVLSQASVLLVTSNPTRTSPTKRGKWVLENILGTPPPPPPPGVGQIKDEKHQISAATLRQLMEEHRKNPTCASCHQRMDPIGFGLENYDVIGRWRTYEGSTAIDSSGILPDGRKFKGPSELKQILLGQKDQFIHALAEKLMTYALGRGVDDTDRCSLDAIVARAKKQNYRMSAVITGVVLSDPFLKRRSDRKG